MDGHRWTKSKMILFRFATQATEQAPGGSIEEPRVRNTNLAALPSYLPVGVDRSEKGWHMAKGQMEVGTQHLPPDVTDEPHVASRHAIRAAC